MAIAARKALVTVLEYLNRTRVLVQSEQLEIRFVCINGSAEVKNLRDEMKRLWPIDRMSGAPLSPSDAGASAAIAMTTLKRRMEEIFLARVWAASSEQIIIHVSDTGGRRLAAAPCFALLCVHIDSEVFFFRSSMLASANDEHVGYIRTAHHRADRCGTKGIAPPRRETESAFAIKRNEICGIRR